MHDFFECVIHVFCLKKSVRWRTIYFLNKSTVTFVNVLINKNEKKSSLKHSTIYIVKLYLINKNDDMTVISVLLSMIYRAY